MPRYGSLQESVLAIVILRMEEIDAAKTRALLQGMLKAEEGPNAWKEFFRLAFPWVETAKKRDEKDVIKRLQEEVARGPLSITPQQEKRFRSRLKSNPIPAPVNDIAKRLASKLPGLHGQPPAAPK